MKTFKELCDGKMWKAVEAMLIGLQEQNKRKDFKIVMETFGRSFDNTCFGCAATCAIQQLTGVNFNSYDIRHEWLRAYAVETDVSDLNDFEMSINDLREGMLHGLIIYFGKSEAIDDLHVRYEIMHIQKSLPRLLNDWSNNLQPYYNLLNFLKQNDL